MEFCVDSSHVLGPVNDSFRLCSGLVRLGFRLVLGDLDLFELFNINYLLLVCFQTLRVLICYLI